MSKPNTRHSAPNTPTDPANRAMRDELLRRGMEEIAVKMGIAPDRAALLIAEGQARGNAIADAIERQQDAK